jgi:hypothetical protein
MATLKQFEVPTELKPDHAKICPGRAPYMFKPGTACHIRALSCEAQEFFCACLVRQDERRSSDRKMHICPDFQKSAALYDLETTKMSSPMV